jgi:hypothetical protein
MFLPSTTLKSLSLLTGNYEWERDLGHFGEIRQVLGICNNHLWILMYQGGEDKSKRCLVCLDIMTGKQSLNIANDLPVSEVNVTYIAEHQRILSIDRKLSTIPTDCPLVELDAQTGKVLRNQSIASLLEHNLKIGEWKYLNNQIFFTAFTDMLTTSHIGILDYHTLALLWFCEVPNRKGFLKDLQVTEDNIYVLDQLGTLHIFEKEEA